MDMIENSTRGRGAMRLRLTRIEWHIATLEGKDSLGPHEQWKVKRLKEQVKEIDRNFEDRHVEALNFIEVEDWATLEAEERIFDETWIMLLTSLPG